MAQSGQTVRLSYTPHEDPSYSGSFQLDPAGDLVGIVTETIAGGMVLVRVDDSPEGKSVMAFPIAAIDAQQGPEGAEAEKMGGPTGGP